MNVRLVSRPYFKKSKVMSYCLLAMYHVACTLEFFHFILHDSMISTIIFNIVSENMGDLLSIVVYNFKMCASRLG